MKAGRDARRIACCDACKTAWRIVGRNGGKIGNSISWRNAELSQWPVGRKEFKYKMNTKTDFSLLKASFRTGRS